MSKALSSERISAGDTIWLELATSRDASEFLRMKLPVYRDARFQVTNVQYISHPVIQMMGRPPFVGDFGINIEGQAMASGTAQEAVAGIVSMIASQDALEIRGYRIGPGPETPGDSMVDYFIAGAGNAWDLIATGAGDAYGFVMGEIRESSKDLDESIDNTLANNATGTLDMVASTVKTSAVWLIVAVGALFFISKKF